MGYVPELGGENVATRGVLLTVDSKKLEHGCRLLYAGRPSFFGLGLEDGGFYRTSYRVGISGLEVVRLEASTEFEGLLVTLFEAESLLLQPDALRDLEAQQKL